MGVLYNASQLKSDLKNKFERQAIINELHKLGITGSFENVDYKELRHRLALARITRGD